MWFLNIRLVNNKSSQRTIKKISKYMLQNLSSSRKLCGPLKKKKMYNLFFNNTPQKNCMSEKEKVQSRNHCLNYYMLLYGRCCFTMSGHCRSAWHWNNCFSTVLMDKSVPLAPVTLTLLSPLIIPPYRHETTAKFLMNTQR